MRPEAAPRRETATVAAQWAEAAPPRTSALLSPGVDALMIGGASLILFAFAHAFVDKTASIHQTSWTAFYLAWAVNNPHFMASYVLLYWDKRKELLTKPSYLWAALVAPTLLVAYFAWGLALGSPKLLSYAVNAMFFLVGWHYIKQIYGTVLIAAAQRRCFFDAKEARVLKLTLLPVWFMSYLAANSGVREVLHYGIGYETFALPPVLQSVNYGALAMGLTALGWVLVRKWAREGVWPGWTALCSFAAIFAWYVPFGYHAHFWYLIPFFHSLQYLLFVAALKRGELGQAIAAAGSDPARLEAARLDAVRRGLAFLAVIVVTGLASFHWIPETLDRVVPYDRAVFGPTLFTFLVITFVNIHHYFIDNVIWRRDNPALRHLKPRA